MLRIMSMAYTHYIHILLIHLLFFFRLHIIWIACPDDLSYDPFAPRPPPSSSEILAEDDQPTTTSPPTLDGSPTEVPFPPSEEEEAAAAAADIKCGVDTKPFELTVLVGDNPSEITWIIVDRCTNEAFHKCNKCYNASPPNFPVSYSGCLPIYYEGDDLRVREYALQMIDTEDEPSYGYTFVYDDETIFDVGVNEQFTNLEFNYFGEDGGGCSQAPSEVVTLDVSIVLSSYHIAKSHDLCVSSCSSSFPFKAHILPHIIAHPQADTADVNNSWLDNTRLHGLHWRN